MKVLGYYISDQGIYVDPDKIKKIKDWPTPKNTKGIQRFTASVNYISQFCPELASIMAPLTELTGDKPFQWTSLQEKVFN